MKYIIIDYKILMKGYAKSVWTIKVQVKIMKYQVKKVSGIGINEYCNRINELYGLIGKCSKKIENAISQENELLKDCKGFNEKLEVIRNKDYKKLDKCIKENRKMRELYIIEKESIECEIQNFIALLVLNAIALNIEYLLNIQVHYKRALNVINESLIDTGIKVYIGSYGCIKAYMKSISTTVSYGCSGMVYKDVYEKEGLYKHEEIISLTEIKREIEELTHEINPITQIEAYKKRYTELVNESLKQFKSYRINSYVKKESGYNDIR